MREEDVDIVEIIMKNMKCEKEMQQRIKWYMEVHKSNCNRYIYENYTREAVLINATIKMITSDLGAEIVRVLNRYDEEEKK